MKILFCNNNLAGMMLFRKEVMAHFVEVGCEVTVVTPDKTTDLWAEKLPDGIKLRRVTMNRTSRNPLLDVVYAVRLARVFRRERPDYIFNYTIKPNIYGAIAARMLGIPCSCMMAGLGYAFTINSLTARMARVMYRIGVKNCQHLLLLNEESVRTVRALGLCDDDKIEFLEGGEGVDLNYYTFTNNQSEGTTFLFIARLIEEKGYRDFVDAARMVKKTGMEARFQVIGEYDPGYPRAVTEEEVERDVTEGVIEYLGTTNDMRHYYRQAGYVICIPSYYSEGLNRSLMEGCATGKPIITTDHPGCRETVVEGKNGFLVPPKDPKALAETMIRYLKLTPEARQSMSIESRKLAERRFDVNHVIEVYDRIVQTVC
jgi:glycosyltransferase involved in cell wall biosynthesis